MIKLNAKRFHSINFILWVYFLVFAVFILLLSLIHISPREEGNSFTVWYDGRAVFTASLAEDAVYVFTVGSGSVVRYEEGADHEAYNIIEVADGKVRVREADCRSQDCVHRGAADWGEIVCLPHSMRIEINGEEAQPPVDY